MSLDDTTEYKVYKFSYKESFGCLKAIGLSITNDLETPVFNTGRNDRSPVMEEFLDVGKPVSKIRVRVFQERGLHFITGIQFCHVDSQTEKSEVLGNLDLHDYGTWTDHFLEPGDQIIGMYGY